MSTPTETFNPEECGGEQYIHPGSENILLIVYASLALGIVSFFTFCVRSVVPKPSPDFQSQPTDRPLVLAPEMEVAVRCEDGSPEPQSQPAYPSRQLPGMDPLAIQDYGGANPRVCRPGRVRCTCALHSSYDGMVTLTRLASSSTSLGWLFVYFRLWYSSLR